MPRGVSKLSPHLRLPNEGSDLQTPATLAIDLRYEQLRIWRRWTWDRFNRLCKFLNLTTAELASIACIPHNQLALFEKRNCIMQGRAANRAAALVLTLLEAHAVKGYSTDVVENPLPDLTSVSGGTTATSSPASPVVPQSA